MKRLLFGLFLLILSNNSIAHVVVWDGKNEKTNIGKSIYLLEDEDGRLTINDIYSPDVRNEFSKSNQTIINFGYTESYYWLHFSLENKTHDELILEIAHAFLPTAVFYYKDSSGTIQTIKAGYNISLKEKPIKHHFQSFPLPNNINEFYIRVLSNSHPLSINIWKTKSFEMKSLREKLTYGFYLGFMFFVILTNIFFFFSLRNWLYLFYAGVVFLYICYATLVMDGFILYVFPKVDLMFWYLTIPSIGVAVQTAYCLVFLEVNKYSKRLNNIIWGVISYFILYAILKTYLPLIVVLTLNTVHALLSFFIMGFVGVKVGRYGSRLGYYYALAYFVYFLLVLTEAIYIQTGKPAYPTDLSFVATATVIEAFILSFLLSKRFEWEKSDIEKAKQETQKKLINSVKENEKIVREQNVELEKKVAQRTERLIKVNKKLELAVATKNKFFSIIAHDLKSPFNSLLGFADLLKDSFHNANIEEQKEYAEILDNGLNTTYKLLDNLLLWSQSQSDSIGFNPEKLNLKLVSIDVIKTLKNQASNKSISIKNNIPIDFFVKADKNMLSTVLRNLISNAIKFSNKNGKITIDADLLTECETPEAIKICVTDNGLGIPSHTLTQLFSLTKNVSRNGTENEEGSGLGLILCKEFIERHDGEIWAESEPGEGSAFSFTVPLS